MPYYGFPAGGDGGEINDHRLLVGRTDANQHPASAISVDAAPLAQIIGHSTTDNTTATVQQALEMIANQSGRVGINPLAATTLGAFRAAVFRDDNTVEYADHDNLDHANRLAGITLATAQAGSPAKICADGLVKFAGWNWSPGIPVFVGKNGALTQSPPSTGFVQYVGFAMARDAILVGIGISIYRG